MKMMIKLLVGLMLICTAACAQRHSKSIQVLMVGGGGSHDFDRWYKQADAETLQKDGLATVTYTDDPAAILPQLAHADVLFLCNNQPIKDSLTREAIMDFAAKGKGLVLAHAAIWYNWADWPAYNHQLVGGGSRGHDRYGEFTVTVNDKKHPVTKKVPATFTLKDELYYYEEDASGPGIKVLATTSADKDGKTRPSLFIVNHPAARIVGFALGHDAASHELPAYQAILRNAVKWAARK